MEATSKWHKFPGLPKCSPEIVSAGLSELWTAITPACRVRSQRGLNRSCSPRRDLSKAMSHTEIGRREKVDSRLLVVGSQTANLTPGPSFAHNLGFRCPNGQCEAIFDIYVSRPFQWHQEHPNVRCFGPCCRALNIRESRRNTNPHFFQVLGFTPTLGQSRVATNLLMTLPFPTSHENPKMLYKKGNSTQSHTWWIKDQHFLPKSWMETNCRPKT